MSNPSYLDPELDMVSTKMFESLTISTCVYYDIGLTAPELSLVWKICVDTIQNQMQNQEMWLLRPDLYICKIIDD